MAELIVHSFDPVVLVGGADVGPDHLSILSRRTTNFVGVDSGADKLLAAGIRPIAVIGDLDSLSKTTRQAYSSILVAVSEQDSVDFEKAVSRVKAPLVYAAGFWGGRVDHSLTALHVMARYRDQPIILLGSHDVSAIVPASGLRFELPKACPIAVMPLEDTRCSMSGVEWPLTNSRLSPLGLTSPSNRAVGGQVTLSASGVAVVSLPIGQLENLAAALS